MHLLRPACLTLVLCHHFPAPSSTVRARAWAHRSCAMHWASLGNLLATPMLQTGLLAPTLIQTTFFTNLMLSGLHFRVCTFFFSPPPTHASIFKVSKCNTSTPLKRQPWRQTEECQCYLQFVRHTEFPAFYRCFITVCVELLLQNKIRALRISSPATSLLGQMPNKNRPFHFWSCFPQTYHTKWFVSLSALAGFPSKPQTLS